jgi:glycosyltransferase involved in cell wall biosynthesis
VLTNAWLRTMSRHSASTDTPGLDAGVAAEECGPAASPPRRPRDIRRLRVALYYPWIYLTSGGERTILELVRRSRHEWTLYTSHCRLEQTFPELGRCKIVQIGRVSVARDIVSVAAAALTIMRLKIPVEEHDALFVVSEGLGDMIAFRNHARPSVCYCLTPLRAAFDEEYQRRSYASRDALGKVALWAGLALFRFVDRLAWKRYTRVLFLSAEVARRAVRGQLAPPGRREVVHPGVALGAERLSPASERFFFLPGRIMWTKNIELGIQAFQRLRARAAQSADFRLVVAGAVDEKSKPYLAGLQALAGLNSGVQFVVAPSDSDLRQLYATCHAVLFTAFNEDFGLTVLEAMAFGKPVIAVDRGGPQETVDDGVDGFRVPADPECFADRMIALLEQPELARRIGVAAFRKAKQFTWERFVDRIDDLLEEITGSPDPAIRT